MTEYQELEAQNFSVNLTRKNDKNAPGTLFLKEAYLQLAHGQYHDTTCRKHNFIKSTHKIINDTWITKSLYNMKCSSTNNLHIYEDYVRHCKSKKSTLLLKSSIILKTNHIYEPQETAWLEHELHTNSNILIKYSSKNWEGLCYMNQSQSWILQQSILDGKGRLRCFGKPNQINSKSISDGISCKDGDQKLSY